MKRFGKVLFVTILSVLLFAGCKMKESMEFEISKEDMKLNLIVAFDDEFIDVMLTSKEDSNFLSSISTGDEPDFSKAKKHTDAERWAYIDSDAMKEDSDLSVNDKYKKTKYDKDGMKGYVYTVPMGKLDDYTVSSSSEKLDLSELFGGDELPKNAPLFIKDGNTYKSNLTYKYESSETVDVDQMEKYMELNIVFNIPNPAKSNNAKSVSNGNKTLTYTLLKGGDIDFEFDYDEATADTPKSLLAKFVEGDNDITPTTTTTGETKTESTDNNNKSDNKIYMYIGIGGACAVVLIVIIIIATSKKPAAPVSAVTPVAPVAPTTPVAPVAPVEPAQPVQPTAPVAEPVQTETSENNNTTINQ